MTVSTSRRIWIDEPFVHEPVPTVVLVALSPTIVLAAAGTALGIGAFSPQFERREYGNVEQAHPSQLVLLGFLFGGGLVFGGGSIGVWLAVGATLDGSLPVLIGAATVVAALLVFSALGVAGYAYAVARFDGLTLEDA